MDLLPFSRGVYGADLGPDPRDAALAAKAFEPNLSRLGRLKHRFDPHNVLAYAFPLLKAESKGKIIILVTGESCTGKDHCANVWASVIAKCTQKSLITRIVSISDITKREYAAATGADLDLLLKNRPYKEQHRPALRKFYEEQIRQRNHLPEEHFKDVVYSAVEVDVLLVTGMRDEAPVTLLSHLVPDSKVIDVRVETSAVVRRIRGGYVGGSNGVNDKKDSSNRRLGLTDSDYRPTLVFNNNSIGTRVAERFAENWLLPYFSQD
jgi:phosphomevalonate kinase